MEKSNKKAISDDKKSCLNTAVK